MKNNPDKYSEISSFEDFHIAKDRLHFRSKLTEMKLQLAYMQVSRMFSLSNLFLSLGREIVLPKVMDFMGYLTKSGDNKSVHESDSNQPHNER